MTVEELIITLSNDDIKNRIVKVYDPDAEDYVELTGVYIPKNRDDIFLQTPS